MSSFGRFTQALGGVVETLTYASPLLTLTQSVGTSPLTATIPSGGISGSGTSGFIPKWTASNIIGDSIISDNGTTANILGISRVSAISPLFELFNTTNGDVWGTLQAVASSGSGSDLIFATKRNGDSLTEKLRITAVGNVGIGTTSPYQAKLDVSGINGVANIGATNSSLDQLLMGSIDRASAPAFFSLPNGSAFIGAIGNGVANTLGIGTFGASPVIFGTSNTEKMRIASGGNVLIGTTTDGGYKLDVNGSGRFSGALLISNNDITQDGTRPIVTLKQSGTTKLLLGISSTADDIIVGDVSGDVDFRTNSQAFNFSVNNGGGIAFKLASNAQATFSSSVYLGTSTIDASAKFQVDSTTKGVLVPRMNEDDINNIASPADGLLVYNLDQQVHCFWDSAQWHKYTHTNM